jgi:hypothetical protein
MGIRERKWIGGCRNLTMDLPGVTADNFSACNFLEGARASLPRRINVAPAKPLPSPSTPELVSEKLARLIGPSRPSFSTFADMASVSPYILL